MEDFQHKSLAVLGSTGSIGRSTLELVRSNPKQFTISLLAAGKNWKELASQIKEFSPNVAVIESEESFRNLCNDLGTSTGQYLTTALFCGERDLLQGLDSLPKETVVIAGVTGMAGLPGVFAAVKAGKTLALANKESLVVAGDLIMCELAHSGATLIPVDSEHSAIFQCLQGERRSDLKSVILTSSGGPLRNVPLAEFPEITVERALKHPKWSMGAKISIDSATMMNKALEVIEARWLFDLKPEQIEVVVHPEHIIHSCVRLVDGSVIAQLANPDMKGPISYALSYPNSRLRDAVEELDFIKVGSMHFEGVDDLRFPGVQLARACLNAGGASGAVFNAANEVAVSAFLARQIAFSGIMEVVQGAVEHFGASKYSSLVEVTDICNEASSWARQQLSHVSKYRHS